MSPRTRKPGDAVTGEREQDDAFVRKYEPFVRGVVKQTCHQLGIESDMDDLVACGFTGLVEARTRFDASHGVPFKSFAYYRVRGAVVDGVRSMAYLPRRAYARLKAAEAIDRAAEQLGQQTAVSERASGQDNQQAGANVRAIDAVLGQAAASYCAALASDDDERSDLSPEASLAHKQRRSRVREAVSKLPDRERQLVEGHDLAGRHLADVAAEMGLSKSWASRIHAKGLERLRGLLREA